MSTTRRFLRSEIGWIVAAGAVLVLVQLGATLLTAVQVERTSERIARDLGKLQAASLADEKTRQEVLDLRIQNEIRGLLSNSLLINIGPIVTAFVALAGALLGLRNYLESREKDRRLQEEAVAKERADREKARADRASAELKDAMDRLVRSGETWQRAAGILGLQHFLAPDFADYHLRAVSALAMAARLENDPEVIGAIRIALEQAAKTVAEEVWQQVSWQWVKLSNAKIMAPSLRHLDLRNAELNDVDFTGCDLSGTLLTNARLKGAKLAGCKLFGADLAYADLAGARLVGADLSAASLLQAKVLHMDIAGADLRTARFDADSLPWELITNWRSAQLDEAVRARLIERFGAEPSGPKVLMLMWELPPFVAGGTWTACYHLVRNLRRAGADLTVVVPWSEGLVQAHPFGAEVKVVPLGIVPPELEPAGSARAWSAYGHATATPDRGASWSVYGAAPSWSPYSGPSWSTYQAPSWSAYGGRGAYSPMAGAYTGGADLPGPSALLRLVDECRRRFVRFARDESFDLIHAHDWVTFPAAAAAAELRQKPWIAHFHSIEIDRRPESPDRAIERLERDAVKQATALVAPSRVSAARIAGAYEIAAASVTVAPNTLSREVLAPAECGLYDTRRVLFLGRLTLQKGPDLFARTATALRELVPGVSFVVHGSGEQIDELRRAGIWPSEAVEWSERGLAFGDKSVLLVPSRAEPFGMVILEAMQRRVPVLYPRHAGAAEVLEAGIPVDPADTGAVAAKVAELLTDRDRWEEVVAHQTQEIATYPQRGYEKLVQELYLTVAEPAAGASARASSGTSVRVPAT